MASWALYKFLDREIGYRKNYMKNKNSKNLIGQSDKSCLSKM